MELIIFGNSISLFNLAVMTFLYIFTISMTLCGTITVDDIKSILSFSFQRKKETEEEDKEGFSNIFKKRSFNKEEKFSQNKCIDNNCTHPLNSKNAYEFEPGSYAVDKNYFDLLN